MAHPNHRLSRSDTLLDRIRAPFGVGRTPTSDSGPNHGSHIGLYCWNDPQDPLVDLVFIHGVCGDATRSFSADQDIASFWPLWLIEDEHSRQRMRLWTFGYHSEQPQSGTILVSNLDGHGINLCEGLSSRATGHTSIIVVSHSLGGLVAKAAVNHSKQTDSLVDLDKRFYALLFLATPHSRTDDHAMVEKIVRFTSERSAVGDLDSNSSVIEGINKTFSRVGRHGIRIWSFFETLPQQEGDKVLLDKQVSTLNLDDEHRIMLHANHLGVAKFNNIQDGNYVEVKEAIVNAVDAVADELGNAKKMIEEIDIIATYFGVSDVDLDELENKISVLTPDTCQWLLQKQSFKNWVEGSSEGPPPSKSAAAPRSALRQYRDAMRGTIASRLFWLIGPPGSGKSHLATKVMEHLKSHECSIYFLRHTDGSKNNIGDLLKSLALQMAMRDPHLRRWLYQLVLERRLESKSSNYHVIWKEIFVQHIFMTKHRPQYWILDAIDESRGGKDLIELLKKIPPNLQYRIFLTSREDASLQKQLGQLPVTIEKIELENSRKDIFRFVMTKRADLKATDPHDELDLVNKIVEKSQGNFLWASLVVEKLSTIYAKEKADEVLESIPDEMNDFYVDILRSITRRESSLDLAQSILRWNVCSIRPLSLRQLQEAILLDIGQNVPRIEVAVKETCGQLVILDQDHVMLAHDTVRSFILRASNARDSTISSLIMDKATAHAHLAAICLKALKGDSPLSIGRKLQNMSLNSSQPPPSLSSSFYEYASLFFSEHVVKSASPGSSTPIEDLVQFLEVNIRNWVEYAASQKDLSRVSIAGENLKSFVESRVLFQTAPRPEISQIVGWANDLIYMVTHFGRFLLDLPSSAHFIIPPLCPPQSALFRQYGSPHLGIEVIGSYSDTWMDRISTDVFSTDYCSVLACSQRYYAVGTRSGTIFVYHAATCQEVWRTVGTTNVLLLEFVGNGSALIAGAKNMMTMYKSDTGETTWERPLQIENRAMACLESPDASEIIAINLRKELVTYNMRTGTELSRSQLQCQYAPMRFYLSMEMKILAISYRNRELEIRHLDDPHRPRYINVCTSVSGVAFNPAKQLMAVGTFNGEVIVIQAWNLQPKTKPIKLSVGHLAVSSDGELLLAGSNDGTVHILKFETLEKVLEIEGEKHSLVDMKFSHDDRRFLDIRGQMFNVWEPSALARRRESQKSSHETSQGRTSYSTAPSGLMQAYLKATKTHVTAMTLHDSGGFVFCGKQNGDVTVHEIHSQGKAIHKLYEHDSSAISFVDWHPTSQLLVTCDRSSRILMHKIKLESERTSLGPRFRWTVTKPLLDFRIEVPVRQILFSMDGEYLIVSTVAADEFWRMNGEVCLSHKCHRSRFTGTASQKWANYPGRVRSLIEIEKSGIHIATWHGDSNLKPSMEDSEIDNVQGELMDISSSHVRLLRFRKNKWAAYDYSRSSRPLIWKVPEHASTSTDHSALDMLEHFRQVVPRMRQVIGEFDSQLVFVDDHGWVCCMRVAAMGSTAEPRRQFPIPHHWQRPPGDPLMLVTLRGDVVLAANDGIIVVKRGLTFQSF